VSQSTAKLSVPFDRFFGITANWKPALGVIRLETF